jgi:cyanophycinase
LGVKHIEVLDIHTNADAHIEDNVEKVRQAGLIFFTGGDQLRITSQLGASPVYQAIREVHQSGIAIVGTSAGAAAMPSTILVSGPSDESFQISALNMAPGLGLIEGVVIDSHFAERRRIGRLLGAVTQNPANLGIGIDEDTAIIVQNGAFFRVLGSGAVYVVDGTEISYSSLAQDRPEGVVSIFDARLHVLGNEDCFDLISRKPEPASQ